MTYKFTVLAKKEFALVSSRQVETVTILPTAGADDKAASDSSEEVSARQRLNATDELDVLVRTVNADVKFKLGSPIAAWEGAKYSGLVADERPAFGDVCRAIFHVEEISSWGKPGSPKSADPELLEALLFSDKVVVERSLTRRDDLDDGGLLSLTTDQEKHFQTMLDGVTRTVAEKAPSDSSSRRPPMVEIPQIGKSSVVSGAVFFAAGMLFLGKFANDGDDPTLAELYTKFTAKEEAKQAAA